MLYKPVTVCMCSVLWELGEEFNKMVNSFFYPLLIVFAIRNHSGGALCLHNSVLLSIRIKDSLLSFPPGVESTGSYFPVTLVSDWLCSLMLCPHRTSLSCYSVVCVVQCFF